MAKGRRSLLGGSLMLLSRPSTYAIRALTYLAMQPPGKLSGTREISASEGIPSFFLGKVLLQLRRARLLRSYKGIGGGYELAFPPDQISLLSVVRCVGGADVVDACILEDRDCQKSARCALHDSWVPIREHLCKMLEERTLADLVLTREPLTSAATEEAPASAGV